MPGNCAFYAFARWHQAGGYLVLRKSARHSVVPHVLHQAQGGALTHYVPVDERLSPHRKLWFDGALRVGDTSPDVARPMPIGHMVAGAWLGAVLVTVWAMARIWSTASQ